MNHKLDSSTSPHVILGSNSCIKGACVRTGLLLETSRDPTMRLCNGVYTWHAIYWLG